MNGNVGVALILGIGSFVLLYGSIKGYDPRSLFTSVFTGKSPTPLDSLPEITGQAIAGAGSVIGSALTGGRPPGAGGATPACSKFVSAVRSSFPKIQNIGITNVRNIAGTNELSQHSYGNACDIMADPATMQQVWAWAISNSARYHVRLTIYNRKQWYRGAVSAYSGVSPHTDHVHVDFYPQYGGTPPGHPVSGG